MKTRNGMYKFSALYSSDSIKEVVLRFKDAEDLPPEVMQARKRIGSPEDVFTTFKPLFDGLTTERFVVFSLTADLKINAYKAISEGILNSSLVHPREVFIFAVASASACIILAHNHPSGNTEPSQEDIAITKQLVEVSKVMGIKIQDHIIFAGDTFTSLAERGIL